MANATDLPGSPQLASLLFGAADSNASTFAPVPRPVAVSEAPLPPPRPESPAIVAAVAAPPAPEPRTPTVRNETPILPEIDSRTAIYDISARTVYLPSGRKLEAHSGLGDKMDDPRYVRVKNRGPTPPNVYKLTLREQPFHGVRAIRLNPVDDKNMFGRDGILAHSYMLGPNGQSNGCVSFSDYPAFLKAFMKGEVERMVVVARLPKRPPSSLMSMRQHNDRYASNDY
ncbi:MAG: DUF2778 domain-containing protein [Rhizobiales bacterium]|nr:DUF2778 domain-containing protein [Hyphomicrobiales bacterium]